MADAVEDAEILEWIEKIVQDELDRDGVNLLMDTVPSDVSGWDSLAHVSIVLAIEKRVGSKFTTGEIDSIRAVSDLVRLARQR